MSGRKRCGKCGNSCQREFREITAKYASASVIADSLSGNLHNWWRILRRCSADLSEEEMRELLVEASSVHGTLEVSMDCLQKRITEAKNMLEDYLNGGREK